MAHTHYKGTGKVHSFKGSLVDGEQDSINIQGSIGAIAWRITKFDIFPAEPGVENYESIVQIWREQQGAPSTTAITVAFNDSELLAAAYYNHYQSAASGNVALVVSFDNQLFVRDIFITHTNVGGTADMNYYIELEEVTVSAVGRAQLAVAAARRTGDTS